MNPSLYVLALVISGAALADTPAAFVMPDGSTDLYLGLGVQSVPRYEGSNEQRTQVMPAIQMQWSNGLFWSGLSGGWHLSPTPGTEYGPLLAVDLGRSHTDLALIDPNIALVGGAGTSSDAPSGSALAVANSSPVRAELGGFLNQYILESTRLTSSVLYGGGSKYDGLLVDAGVQTFFQPAAHHTVSFSAGLSWANRAYAASYFGVDPDYLVLTQTPYSPHAGPKDMHASAHWNWALSRTWLLTSQVTMTRLMGSAADSPLTSQRDNMSASVALAYRF